MFSKENSFSSSIEQANEAIKYISETVKWFITIQAGILGFIGNLLLKAGSTDKKNELINNFFIPVSFWCMSILCGAWVLTGLPSIILRLEDPEYCKGFDVLIMPIYSWLFDIFNLSLFYSLVHWYWALGVLSFGYVFIWKKT